MTNKQKEQLATEIFEWLLKRKMWIDVSIYFNDKCWSTSNKENNQFCYNEHKYFEYDANPEDYFEYVAEPNILSMSFEGPLNHVLNGYIRESEILEDEFSKIFEKYGLYYEMGYSWSLTCYEE